MYHPDFVSSVGTVIAVLPAAAAARAPMPHADESASAARQPELQHVTFVQQDRSEMLPGLLHFAFADEPLPAYLQQLHAVASSSPGPQPSLPIAEVRVASERPLHLSAVHCPSSMHLRESRVISSESGSASASSATASLQVIWTPAVPSPSSSSALPQQQQQAANSSTSPLDEFHSRSESIRSLLFDTGTDAEVNAPDHTSASAGASTLHSASPSLLLSHVPAAEVSVLPELSRAIHEQHPLPMLAQQPPISTITPSLDALPALRTLVQDRSVLPASYLVETPMPPIAETSQLPQLPHAPSPASVSTLPPMQQEVVLPSPQAFSPPEPATLSPIPNDVQRVPQRKEDDTEHKEAEADTVSARIGRFSTPPLPASRQITRALTASAASSPAQPSLRSLLDGTRALSQRAAALFKDVAVGHRPPPVARRSSVGRTPGSASPCADGKGDSPNPYAAPPPLRMLRQRSLLDIQQAAAAGIAPYRSAPSSARSLALQLGAPGHRHSPASFSHPASAVSSPTGGHARCPPVHPFVDASGGGSLATEAECSAQVAATLAALKAQMDELIERRVQEVRRELSDLAAAHLQQMSMALAAGASSAALSSGALSGVGAAAAASSASLPHRHFSPFHAPTPQLPAGTQPSGVHAFVEAPLSTRAAAGVERGGVFMPLPLASPARMPTPRAGQLRSQLTLPGSPTAVAPLSARASAAMASAHPFALQAGE